MKKIISLLLAVLLVFTLVACTPETIVRELTYSEMKVIEDDIKDSLQEEFDRDLQRAKDALQPDIIYRDGKEYVEIEKIVPRELTKEELDEFEKDMQKEYDIQLKYAIDHLEPTIKEVEKEVIVNVDIPIEDKEYEFGYDICVTFVNDGDNYFHLKGIIKPTIIGTLFGANYNIELDKPNAAGATEYAFKNEEAYTVCYRTFGDKTDGFDSDYPGWLPTEAPEVKDEED